jgi:hypothetical protein
MKFNIIGDSFVMYPNPNDIPSNYDDFYWIDILKRNFPNHTFFVDGIPSRNAQSMIDNWIKLLPVMSKDDYLIIGLPFFGRTRLPMKLGQGQYTEKNEFVYLDRFIGTYSYNPSHCDLEFWNKDYDRDYMTNLMVPQEIINSSDSSHYNFIEIIESLIKITPCKTYVYSWDDMKIKSDVIEDKSMIIKNLGYWETFEDVYRKTEGKEGMHGNFHWSFPFNKSFGNYVLSKFI